MSKLEELIQKLCPNGVEYRPLGEVVVFNRGKAITQKDIKNGEIPVIAGGQKPAYYCNEHNRTGETIVIAGSGAYAGYVSYWNEPIFVSDAFSVDIIDNQLLPRFLFHFLLNNQNYIYAKKKGSGVPHVYGKDISNLRIPVPPIEVQEEIVRILDKFTELTARKKQYEFYRDQVLSAQFDKQTWLSLSEVILSLNTGLNPRQFFKLNTEDAVNYYVTIREIQNHKVIFSEKTDRINDHALKLCNNRSNLEKGDVLFSGTGTIGETALIEETPHNWNIKEGVYTLKPNPQFIISKYLIYLLENKQIQDSYMKKAAGGTVKSVPMVEMKKLKIPVPPLEEQKRIVAILDRFDKLCSDISEGLPAEIEARQKQYEYYRDKLLTFEEIAQ